MTRHNLQTHLAWLLESSHDAHIPRPTVALSAISTVALGAEPYSLSQLRSQISDELYLHRTQSALTNGHRSGDREESAPPSLPPVTSKQPQSSETMARLQSGTSSSTKPRLISRAQFEPAPTPRQHPRGRPGTSLKDQYNAAYSGGNLGKYGCDMVRTC